jgi:hypothetical protein
MAVVVAEFDPRFCTFLVRSACCPNRCPSDLHR